MNTQPEALRCAEHLEKVANDLERGMQVWMTVTLARTSVSELRRLQAENERLNKAIQYEQHRAERIGTHGPGCELWGPAHYECLVRAHEAIKAQRGELLTVAEYVRCVLPNERWADDIKNMLDAAIASVKDAA